MLFEILALFVLSSVSTEAGFIDSLSKCSIHDAECQKNFLQTVIRDISKTGVPELEIPPLDPIHLQDFTVSIFNVTDITLVEGNLKGLKNCIVERFVTTIEQKRMEVEITCDLTVKGAYKIVSIENNPVFKNLFGNNPIHGEGQGKIHIEKLHLKFDWHFKVHKNKDDGITYFKLLGDTLKFDYKVLGKTTFAADNIYLGNEESTKLVVDMLNQNEKLLVSTFGRYVIDIAVDKYIKVFVGTIFNKLPAENIVIEKLDDYLDNE